MNKYAVRLLSAFFVTSPAVIGALLPHSIVLGGCAWAVAVLFSLSGWGTVVSKAFKIRVPDFGLRACWGAGLYLTLAGALLMAQRCNITAVRVLFALGLVAECARYVLSEQSILHEIGTRLRTIRKDPTLAGLLVVFGTLIVFQFVAGVAELDRNPWDDDIAYTPFLKRLLDVGNMNEPFSFRRLSAYGGQTVLQALIAARGNTASVNALDHSICFTLVLALVWGYGRRCRTEPVWVALIYLMLLLAPPLSINTASYWSGVAFIFATYRTLVELEQRRELLILGLIAGATCTLRQNYLPAVSLFIGLTLLFKLRARNTTLTNTLRDGALIGAGTLTVLLPFAIAAFQSNKTFLYPFIPGTWNTGIKLTPTALSWLQELQFFIWCFVEPYGIVVVAPLFCALLFTIDTRANRPITALLIASILAFILLVHSFTSSDPGNLWRYAFGYSVTLTLALCLETGASSILKPLKQHRYVTWLILAAIIYQTGYTRYSLPRQFRIATENIANAFALNDGKEPSRKPALYRELQQSIPANASAAILLDEPFHLDFKRNNLYLLDTPGWSGLRPGYPSFEGPERVRNYFIQHNIRYLIFVHYDYSSYFYRRQFWIWRLYTDAEVFRIMAAYILNAVETYAELATRYRVVFVKEGHYVIDLERSL